MLSQVLVDQVLAAIPHRRIGLVGDLFLDRYLDIDAALTEPSIETGLDAYQITGVRSNPGALGTIINNLVALGVGSIQPVALIGDDGEGYELRQALQRMPGVSLDGLVNCPGARTPTYTKPMLHRPGKPADELNRLDIKNRRPTPRIVEDQLIDLFESWWEQVDAWIVLDQVSEEDCGVITRRVRERIADRAGQDAGRFVLADSRERISQFQCVSAKPNAREAESYPGGAAQFAVGLGRPVFLTRGEQGIDLYSADGELENVPGYPVNGPIDIVGAGDSTSAGIACAVVSGLTMREAAAFGNLVASITVQQLGTTGTATPAQVRDRYREVSGS
ncbi:bifunctional heptose 7-phosphate kinase/heptose 1-phosphate adenyltransferase [Zavarzinella formosa]|uniref:bifunctional heptose 7-phosphate kinase/heptose 1-phosphate adenyltransferase n=1 Tax=Zavarzinella formosa TaxID=360055 RepID=UPI0002F37B8A|nr:PfkB family carbohydrate kinase [Zavarzinella formosa]